MIRIADDIEIDKRDLKWDFVRATGPGGQHVNKVATAVILRFDAARSRALTDRIRHRLKQIAGRKMSADGYLLIKASRFRSQAQNRQDAIERLRRLIQRAMVAPKPRRRTRPTRSSKERRLAAKQHRSRTKQMRARVRS